MSSEWNGSKILLVGEVGNSCWLKKVKEVADSLECSLKIIEQSSIQKECLSDFDLVIVDAGIVKDPLLLVKSIRERYQSARVVVYSPLDEWRQANEFMLAGAIDCSNKYISKEEIRKTLEECLRRKAPSWQFWSEPLGGGEE